MRPMSVSELIVMLSTLRLGGAEANMKADALLETAPAARPEGFARAIAEVGARRPEMVRLARLSGLNRLVAEHARDRARQKDEEKGVGECSTS